MSRKTRNTLVLGAANESQIPPRVEEELEELEEELEGESDRKWTMQTSKQLNTATPRSVSPASHIKADHSCVHQHWGGGGGATLNTSNPLISSRNTQLISSRTG